MSEETKLESIPETQEEKTDLGETVVPKEEKVEEKPKDEEINSEMAKEPSPPKISSQSEDKEENAKRKQVNKKLSAMSKNIKEKRKNKPLKKPTTSTIPKGSLSKMLNINPMYLLGIIGVCGIKEKVIYGTQEAMKTKKIQKKTKEKHHQKTLCILRVI